MKQQRRQLIDTALQMNALGINQGSSGNVSLRNRDSFLITPTGMPYDSLELADIVQMPIQDGQGTPRLGQRKPSSEWRFHRDVYQQRHEFEAIVHVHSTAATALACLRQPIPAFHYMVAAAGGNNIRCADYALFGTQALSDTVLVALQGRRACLMANHGLLACGADLAGALALAVEVEQLAEQYLAARAVAEPTLLSDAQMQQVIEKFAGYGQQE